MRILILLALAAAVVLPVAGMSGSAVADQANFTTIPTQTSPVRPLYAHPNRHVVDNACGLCTDTECCGGASLGWKLCQDGCPSGQKKCMMVATCP